MRSLESIRIAPLWHKAVVLLLLTTAEEKLTVYAHLLLYWNNIARMRLFSAAQTNVNFRSPQCQILARYIVRAEWYVVYSYIQIHRN